MPDDQPAQPPGWQRTFKVHDLADTFPMLSDLELVSLAKDIHANGLKHAITLDHTGEVLLDGRNRLAACRMAEVEPRFELLPQDTDQTAFIISSNIERRHLNAGQRAIALALAHPEPKRGMHAEFRLETGDVSKTRLSQAREIVRHLDLARLVMEGTLAFERALAEVRFRAQGAASMAKHLRELKNEAPDLAEEVLAETCTLYDAWTEYERRQRAAKADLKEQREGVLRGLVGVLIGWDARLAKDQSFRAGIITKLNVEPSQVGAVLKAIGELIAAIKEDHHV